MRATDLEEILSTVRAARDEQGVDVHDTFLEAIVRAEADNLEDELAARAQIERAVNAALEKAHP